MVFTMASCSKQEPTTVESQVLHISFSMDPPTLDARKSGDFVSSTALFMLFDGLMKLQSDGRLTPSLAKSYDVSPDGLTYTFHLRDAYWSDHTPITAYDFEKSWKKILDPSFPSLCPQLFYCIQHAEEVAKKTLPLDQVGFYAKDEKTFVVHLQNPTPYFLSLTSFCVFFPVPSHIDEAYPAWAQEAGEHFVSSGPFILEKWERNNEILVKKNPLYWDKDNIHIDGIHISIVDNSNTALEMFKNHQLDFLGTPVSPLPLDAAQSLKAEGKVDITPIGGLSFCSFNVNEFPFNNKNIRKAFSLAMDRNSLVTNVTQLGETTALRTLPPCLCPLSEKTFFEDNQQQKALEYLEEGLKELGIKKTELSITLSHGASDLQKKIAQALSDHWEKTLHVQISLDQAEDKMHWERLHKHRFQLGLTSLIIQYFDPMNIFERFKYKEHSKNYSGWENEEFIKLLNASAVEVNSQKRFNLLEKAEELFMEEMPITPIYHFIYATLKQDHVKDIVIGPVGDVHLDSVSFPKRLK